MPSRLVQVDQTAFDAFLSKHPRAKPDGARRVEDHFETRYYEDALEIARVSWDDAGPTYWIREAT